MNETQAKLDQDLMKQVNRQFVTGVTVVTVMDGDRPRGLAVNAFCQHLPRSADRHGVRAADLVDV